MEVEELLTALIDELKNVLDQGDLGKMYWFMRGKLKAYQTILDLVREVERDQGE